MDDTPATFEQLVYVLSGSISKVTTGVTDTAGSGKIWTYTVASTAAPTVQTYTIEMGDDQRVDEMEYAYVENFTLSGAKGEAVMLAAEWRGRQATDTGFHRVGGDSDGGRDPVQQGQTVHRSDDHRHNAEDGDLAGLQPGNAERLEGGVDRRR